MSTLSAEARPRASLSVYAALSAHTLISTGTYLVAKRTITELSPLNVVLCRFALSGVVFALVLAALPARALPPRSALPAVLGLGLLAGPVNQGLFFWGLSRSTPTHASLLYALTPVGVFLYALVRGTERASARRWVGIGLALAGVVVLLLGRGLRAARAPLLGDVFILAAVAAWVAYTSEGKPLVREFGALRATAWTMLAASLLSLPLAPWMLDLGRVQAASPTALWGIVYLGLLASVASYLLWYYALERTEASRAAVFSNLQPVATAVLAWLVLGDAINWEIASGGALVLAGVFLSRRG